MIHPKVFPGEHQCPVCNISVCITIHWDGKYDQNIFLIAYFIMLTKMQYIKPSNLINYFHPLHNESLLMLRIACICACLSPRCFLDWNDTMSCADLSHCCVIFPGWTRAHITTCYPAIHKGWPLDLRSIVPLWALCTQGTPCPSPLSESCHDSHGCSRPTHGCPPGPHLSPVGHPPSPQLRPLNPR